MRQRGENNEMANGRRKICGALYDETEKMRREMKMK